MEFVPCPACGSFNLSSAKECQDCHAVIPEEAESPAASPLAVAPSEPPKADDAPPPEAPRQVAPPFEAPPDVRAKVDQLEAEILKKPSARALYLQLAQIYVNSKRPDLAAETIERCLAFEPSNAYLRHRLGQILGQPPAPQGAPAEPSSLPPLPTSTVRASTATATPGTPRPAASGRTVAVHAFSRPQAPPVPNMLGGLSRKKKLGIAASLAVVALVLVVKLWLFPSTRCLVTGNFRAYAPAWSPTGKHVAFLMQDEQATRLGLYDLGKNTFRAVAPVTGGGSHEFSWSPDGTKLAYAAPRSVNDWQQAVFVVDINGGQPKMVAVGSTPDWALDGRTLVMVCPPEGESFSEDDWGGRYCEVNIETGALQRDALKFQYGAAVSAVQQAVVFEQSPPGVVEQAVEQAASAGQAQFEQLVDNVTAGRARNVAEGHRDLSRELEARQYAKRREAAMTAEHLPYASDVFVADLATGMPRAVASQSAFPSWTEEGARILFATNGATGLDFCTIKPDGTDRQIVLSGIKGVDPYTVQLSSNGRYVFFVAAVPGNEGVAKLMTGETPADLHVAAVGARSAKRLENKHPFKQRYAVSPDGKRIVYEVFQDVKMLTGAGKSELWLMRW
jgi:hypothetical protein